MLPYNNTMPFLIMPNYIRNHKCPHFQLKQKVSIYKVTCMSITFHVSVLLMSISLLSMCLYQPCAHVYIHHCPCVCITHLSAINSIYKNHVYALACHFIVPIIVYVFVQHCPCVHFKFTSLKYLCKLFINCKLYNCINYFI